MRESVFIKRFSDRWLRFEKMMKDGETDRHDLSDLYIQITDDLSYARSTFPTSRTTKYLNQLAFQAHLAIYKNRMEKTNRFKAFFLREVPAYIAKARTEMILSLAVFVGAIIFATVSTLYDPGFSRDILGDRYVQMTLANIEKGEPMAVYKTMRDAEMFIAITLNNFRVSVFALVAGILWGLGTVYVLISNGLMVGTFFTFLYQRGILDYSASVVMLHGTLELTTIVIVGGAGLYLGRSLVRPESFSRTESLKQGARTAIRICLGVTPVIIMAGFIEGFFTRYSDMHWVFKSAIIGGSLGFIAWYYVWMPIQAARREPSSSDVEIHHIKELTGGNSNGIRTQQET